MFLQETQRKTGHRFQNFLYKGYETKFCQEKDDMTVPARSSEFHGKPIAIWLFTTAFMVFAMAVIGAITRLTESGLSMVEWRPLIGTLPPLSQEEWERVFNLYRETPEYQKKNFGLSMAEFQYIFFWEWFHRLWGRMIGLIYALPFFYFLIRGMIPKGYHLKLFGLLLLGGAQGLMGWFMVQSGLIDRPSVSHYRLAAHLGLAFLIFGLLIWLGLSLWKGKGEECTASPVSAFLRGHGWMALGMLSVTIIWGAFVAGLDAGLVYNSFPKMGDHFYPAEIQPGLSLWLHIFENHAWVQFTHRWLGVLTGLFVLSFALHAWVKGDRRGLSTAIGITVIAQIVLGIATLLTQVWIPLAALHQAGALILVGFVLASLHSFKKR